jgi:hypothetical protein
VHHKHGPRALLLGSDGTTHFYFWKRREFVKSISQAKYLVFKQSQPRKEWTSANGYSKTIDPFRINRVHFISVADPDPRSGIRCLFDPWSWIWNRSFLDPRSRFRIQNAYFW